jgi:predicted RNase H-like HicB family nuclease
MCQGLWPRLIREMQMAKARKRGRQFDVVIERDEDGYYVASVPALKGCHTQAKSLDQLMERIKEAIELCLEVADDEGAALDFVGVRRVTIS